MLCVFHHSLKNKTLMIGQIWELNLRKNERKDTQCYGLNCVSLPPNFSH